MFKLMGKKIFTFFTMKFFAYLNLCCSIICNLLQLCYTIMSITESLLLWQNIGIFLPKYDVISKLF